MSGDKDVIIDLLCNKLKEITTCDPYAYLSERGYCPRCMMSKTRCACQKQESLFDEDDVAAVMRQSLCTKQQAKDALDKNNGDIVDAILENLDDITTVIKQTGLDAESAERLLKKHNGDLIEAILSIE